MNPWAPVLRVKAGDDYKLVAQLEADIPYPSALQDRMPPYLLVSLFEDDVPEIRKDKLVFLRCRHDEDERQLDIFLDRLKERPKVAVIPWVGGKIYLLPYYREDDCLPRKPTLVCLYIPLLAMASNDDELPIAKQQEQVVRGIKRGREEDDDTEILERYLKQAGDLDEEVIERVVMPNIGLGLVPIPLARIDPANVNTIARAQLCASDEYAFYCKYSSVQYRRVAEFTILDKRSTTFPSTAKGMSKTIEDVLNYIDKAVDHWIPVKRCGALLSLHFGAFRRTMNFHAHLLCDLRALLPNIFTHSKSAKHAKTSSAEYDYDSLSYLLHNSFCPLQLCTTGVSPVEVELHEPRHANGKLQIRRKTDGFVLTRLRNARKPSWFPDLNSHDSQWVIEQPPREKGTLFMMARSIGTAGADATQPSLEYGAIKGQSGRRQDAFLTIDDNGQGLLSKSSATDWAFVKQLPLDASPVIGMDHSLLRQARPLRDGEVLKPVNEYWAADLANIFHAERFSAGQQFTWDHKTTCMRVHPTLPILLFSSNRSKDLSLEKRRKYVVKLVRYMVEFIEQYSLDAHIVLPIGDGAFGYTSNGQRTELACTDVEEADQLLAYMLVNPPQFYQRYPGDPEKWLRGYLEDGNQHIYT